MLSLITSFLPYLLILYFLYRSFKEPVFMMGIPFLMFIRTSIFFDNVQIFRIPMRSFESIDQNPDIFLLVWLIIFWIIFRIRIYDRTSIKKSVFPTQYNTSILDYFIIGLIGITIIGLGIVLNEYFDKTKVYEEFITLLSLFIGYFIIKDLVSKTEETVLKNFLFSIVLINTIASILYFVHQGLQIEIYASTENDHKVVDFAGQVLTRTFWYMPILWFFSISYLLVFIEEMPVISITMLLINLLGVYISYTRSFLIIAVLMIVLYALIIGFKNNKIGKSIVILSIFALAGIGLFMALSTALPASTKYFQSRFEELNTTTSNERTNNLVYRFYKTNGVMKRMHPSKEVFGYGSVTEKQNPFVRTVNLATMDMGWAEVVFRWGFLGLFIFGVLYIISTFKAFYLFLKTDGVISKLALLLLLTIVSQLIEGFTSWGIMSPNRFALSLWYFGLLSGLLIVNKNDENQKQFERDHL